MQVQEAKEPKDHPIVLFDGVCNYCNSMVNFAIKHNSKLNLRYTPLQSVIGKGILAKFNIPQAVDSLVFIENNKAYIYSTAALKICKNLDYPNKIFYVLIIVPQFIRDYFYKLIAKNRYKWFGKKEQCMIPSKEVKELFIH